MAVTVDLKASLERVVVVASSHAARVDAEGAFPEASVGELAQAGLLGLVSAPAAGGLGGGLAEAATVVETIARECASSAMVACMHYCAVAVIEAHGPDAVRREIAAGRHLSTLAFSEGGSRSHFWAPLGTAQAFGDSVRLTGKKSWVTSAHHADSYVWSSRPVSDRRASTLWLVPRRAPGLRVDGRFDGLGLRGNDSAPVTGETVEVPASSRLGEDGGGFGIMMGVVLPWFSVLSSAVCAGLMESAVAKASCHAARTKLEHAGSTLADLPTLRASLARMRVRTDQVRALASDTCAAIAAGREDAVLRILECKASAGDAAAEVTDLAMRVCGGAAFRKEAGVERVFRDARAALVMAPTSDVLYDFIGKSVCGLSAS